jgi:hypothetical protein
MVTDGVGRNKAAARWRVRHLHALVKVQVGRCETSLLCHVLQRREVTVDALAGHRIARRLRVTLRCSPVHTSRRRQRTAHDTDASVSANAADDDDSCTATPTSAPRAWHPRRRTGRRTSCRTPRTPPMRCSRRHREDERTSVSDTHQQCLRCDVHAHTHLRIVSVRPCRKPAVDADSYVDGV